ncbi:MAG: alpha/beta hydrolase [Crocinitomicaceae bacterium]|nr:alpha/beta hydrolase [Crocinitomicaceae bacterium]
MKFIPLFLFFFACQSDIKETKELNNFNTHYEVYGEGTPILIINGGPGMNSIGFRGLAKELGKNHKAIIYDQRGTGGSIVENPSEDNITLDFMVQDIENLRKELKIEKWFVLGHSFGGMLGSYYATKHPESIQGLILSASGGMDLKLFDELDIRGRLSKEDLDSLNYYNQKIDEGDTSFAVRLGRGRHLAPAYLYKKEYVEQIAIRLTQAKWEINSLVFQNMRKIGFDCNEKLKNFQKPALIIQGKEDIIPISFAERAQKTLPNSKLVLIPECAHYPWLEQPGIYFNEINLFISANQ